VGVRLALTDTLLKVSSEKSFDASLTVDDALAMETSTLLRTSPEFRFEVARLTARKFAGRHGPEAKSVPPIGSLFWGFQQGSKQILDEILVNPREGKEEEINNKPSWLIQQNLQPK
jgi:hypothetical protein